jgi:hypothetical protein
MTTEQERKKIKKRMTAAGITAGAVIRESKYTNFRNFLNGTDITNDNLNAVKQALTRLEAIK